MNFGDIHVMSNHSFTSVIVPIAETVEQFIRTQTGAYFEHSTQTCLHRVINDWLEHMKENEITSACICMTDTAKCFDTIIHIIVFKKVTLYGIKNGELYCFYYICSSANRPYFVMDNCHLLWMSRLSMIHFYFFVYILYFHFLLEIVAW